MPGWVASEAAKLAIASDVMLAVGAATVLAFHGAGVVVHHRAATPAMTWSQSLVAAAHGQRRAGSSTSRPARGPIDGANHRNAVAQAMRASGAAGGVVAGLVGVTAMVTRGHAPIPQLVLVGALVLCVAAVVSSLARSRSSDTRLVLSRRGPHLVASAVFREATGVGAMVVPVLVVAHTAGLTGTSLLEVSAVALTTRLVIAAVPVAAGLIVADLTMVVGLAWMNIPVPVGIAAVIVWRLGSVMALLAAMAIAHRTEPVTLAWDLPSKDGAGRRLHRTVFVLLGVLPSPVRARARAWFFDTMFSLSPDPWGYSDIPYEQRKRHHLLDAVGPEARVVVEVGCADGHNLVALAHALPTATIVGTDVSTAAVRIATDRARAVRNIRVVTATDRAGLVEALPGPADCVVLAEVLYYLGGRQATSEALAPLREILSPGARVVMIHGCADAQTLHARAAAALGLNVVQKRLVSDPERPFEVAIAAAHH